MFFGEFLHEKNVPAQQTEARPDSRVSRPHGYPRWPAGAEAPARQGPRAPYGLTATHSRKITIAPLPILPAGEHQQNFPRQLRLLHATSFDNVFQNGQRSADRFFTILFHQNALSRPRLGFAISKQKVRRAVGRNRLRRLVRESFRLRAATLPAVDLVVLARDATTTAARGELVASLEKHWARVTTGAGKPIGNSHT